MNCYDDDWLVEHLTPRPDFIFFGRMLIFSKKSEFELNGTSTRCCILFLNCLDVYISSIIIYCIFYHRPLQILIYNFSSNIKRIKHFNHNFPLGVLVFSFNFSDVCPRWMRGLGISLCHDFSQIWSRNPNMWLGIWGSWGVGELVGWLVGWFVGWWVGRLVGW